MTACHDLYAFDDTQGPDRRIVVGVDPSDASRAALRWAVQQARLSGTRVEAVLVYQPDPYLGFAYGDYPAVPAGSPDQVRREALDALRSTVASVVPAADMADVELVLLAGTAPSTMLTHHAADASLLVVGGSRRHGLGVLLGSTAAGCVRHASCPVVVVPTGAGAAHARRGTKATELV